MELRDAVAAVAKHPAAVPARAALATVLTRQGVPAATILWRRAVELAAGRGQFFAALTLARRHLKGQARRQALEGLARRFSAERRRGRLVPPPMARSKPIELPTEQAELIQKALEIGGDNEGLLLPEDAPMPEVPIFGALPPAAFVDLAEVMEEVPLQKGDALVRQGEDDRNVYLLVWGEGGVLREMPDGSTVELARAKAPAVIGEMALLTTVPRRASVVSAGLGLAYRIGSEALDTLGEAHIGLLGQLSEIVKKRLLTNALRNSRILAAVGDKEKVLASFRLRAVKLGEEVFPQGAPAPGLFVILHGEAEAWATDENGQRVRLSVLDEGDAFGEISLLTGQPTTAAIQMPEGGVLMHLTPDAFAELDAEAPELSEELMGLMDVRKGELTSLLDPVDQVVDLDADPIDEWLARG
jgi:CRP-like cAMP-binding protein